MSDLSLEHIIRTFGQQQTHRRVSLELVLVRFSEKKKDWTDWIQPLDLISITPRRDFSDRLITREESLSLSRSECLILRLLQSTSKPTVQISILLNYKTSRLRHLFYQDKRGSFKLQAKKPSQIPVPMTRPTKPSNLNWTKIWTENSPSQKSHQKTKKFRKFEN